LNCSQNINKITNELSDNQEIDNDPIICGSRPNKEK
jgi:hypothetical protein